MVRIVPHAQKSLDEQTRGKGWSVRRGIHDDGTPDDGSDDDNTKKTSPKKLPKVLTCCLKYMRRADKELPETLEEAGEKSQLPSSPCSPKRQAVSDWARQRRTGIMSGRLSHFDADYPPCV